MNKFHNLIETILNKGFTYTDKSRDIKRIQIPHYTFIHDFKDGFPAITTKKLYWKGVVGELLWFLRGDTNIKYLVDNDINIWNKDAYNWFLKNNILPEDQENHKKIIENLGEYLKGNNVNLGRVYGAQWRSWAATVDDYYMGREERIIDQISNLIKGLKENPMGTRHIVTAWNPAELDKMALPPCHWSFEILVEPLKDKCNCSESESINCGKPLTVGKCQQYQFTLKWHQRSVDTFLGLPFNIASYALLAYIIGKLTNMVPKGIIGDLSNVHLYENHIDAAKELLTRKPYKLPELGIMDHINDLINNYNHKSWPNINLNELFNNFRIKDFKLLDYKSHPAIKAEMIAPKQ